MENSVQQLSDNQLFNLCQRYGEQARIWRQKFIGLLPEVNRRRLFAKKGFSSIFEFSKKLAGLSEEQVCLALNLEKKFEKRGAVVLKGMLEAGEVSVNKLARVVSIADSSNQEFLAAQVKQLSQKALETLVRDEKYLRISGATSFSNSQIVEQFLRAQKSDDRILNAQEPKTLMLSYEVKQKLLELQLKGIDINSLILEFLKKRDEEIKYEKEKLSEEAQPTGSRYIPVQIRKILKKEFGTKCSIVWCMREADEIHHSQRFSLSRRHDPKYLAPFCEEHHAIAHSIDQRKISMSSRAQSRLIATQAESQSS